VLPNLIIPGAGKSGTSSLHRALDTHPAVFMSAIKEPHFFSHADRYETGREEYEAIFAAAGDAAIRGESSTGYFIFPQVPQRISSLIPDCRLIFLLRNPVDRALSHYRWLCGLGLENRDFQLAFMVDADEVPDPTSDRFGNYGYIFQEGCYASALRRFLDVFDTRQTLTLIAEEFSSAPEHSLATCAAFLGLPPFPAVPPVRENVTARPRFPRLHAFVAGEGRFALDGPRRRLGAAAHRLAGDRAARRVKSTLTRALSVGGADPAGDVDRRWIAQRYTAEVDRLRDEFGVARSSWLDDFPLR
jgi:sulfotransferase family protein